MRIGFCMFDSIDALHAFYRMPKCLIDETFFPEFHSDLIWIRTLTTFFSSFLRDPNITKSASEMPLNGVSLACR